MIGAYFEFEFNVGYKGGVDPSIKPFWFLVIQQAPNAFFRLKFKIHLIIMSTFNKTVDPFDTTDYETSMLTMKVQSKFWASALLVDLKWIGVWKRATLPI